MILDEILGRIEDYIITPEGRFVGRLDHLFKDAKYVKNGQIVQNDIEQVIIRIERKMGSPPPLKKQYYAKREIGLVSLFAYNSNMSRKWQGNRMENSSL